MWVDVPQISLLSFFFLSEASRQYKKKTLPGTEPSGQVFKWVRRRRYPLFAAVEIPTGQVPVRSRAEGASLGAGRWVLGGTLVLKGPGREVDDRKWTEWVGELVALGTWVLCAVRAARLCRRARPRCVWRRPLEV